MSTERSVRRSFLLVIDSALTTGLINNLTATQGGITPFHYENTYPALGCELFL